MISFVMPLHNEEKNAGKAITRITAYAKGKKWQFEVIPVDDRSTDSTAKIIKSYARTDKKVRPLFRKKDSCEAGNTMGKALMEGTMKAKGDIIIWTMGDLADDTKSYGKIVEKIQKGYDLVFGSRYMPGGSSGNLDRIKAFLSSWGTRIARLLFGIKVHDITNAFRGFRKEIIREIKLVSPGFAISPEFAIKAHRAGFRLGEIPTVYTNRIEGVSSFKLFKMMKSYLFLYFKIFTGQI